MLSKKEFDILIQIHNTQLPNKLTQRMLAKLTGYSLGSVNNILSQLREKKYIQSGSSLALSPIGTDVLNSYRVDNAIIMAAGMSSRFTPISYEKPKGLLTVKGEVLIERQIRQLQEAGISDITIVIGYMKEQFFYLEEKYGVEIVVNEDYYRYNNTSTLMAVLDRLKNTYICSSDNYFTENVFFPYEYNAYYAAMYSPGETNEWCVETDKKDLIRKVKIGGKESLYMMGHVYFDKSFSNSFTSILRDEYHHEATKQMLWEEFYCNHIDQLPLYVKRFSHGEIFEFDSLEDLRIFDKDYLENTNSKILQNICHVLKCAEHEITNIKPLKKGPSGISFKFFCHDQSYIYRHPNMNLEEFTSYQHEYNAMQIAKSLNLYNDLIYIDAHQFWKIYYFSEDQRQLDYNNWDDVSKALTLIKRLHFSGEICECTFNLWSSTQKMTDLLSKTGRLNFSNFYDIYATMEQLNNYVQNDHFPSVICNNNFCDENISFNADGYAFVPDWKYAGMGDPYNDIGTFICCSNYSYKEIMEILSLYHDRQMTFEQKRHALACIALSSYHWYIWAIYQDHAGTPIGNNTYKWFKTSQKFCNMALELYK